VHLERLLLLDDSRGAGAGHCDLLDHSESEANSHPLAGYSSAAGDTGITSGGSILFDVYSLGLLVMSVVGRIRNSDRCRFATIIWRNDDRLGHATVGLCMCYAVGAVESRNLGRPKHSGNSRAISLLAFGGYGYGWIDMPSGSAVSGYADYSWL